MMASLCIFAWGAPHNSLTADRYERRIDTRICASAEPRICGPALPELFVILTKAARTEGWRRWLRGCSRPLRTRLAGGYLEQRRANMAHPYLITHWSMRDLFNSSGEGIFTPAETLVAAVSRQLLSRYQGAHGRLV
jgi:hypothetical protein